MNSGGSLVGFSSSNVHVDTVTFVALAADTSEMNHRRRSAFVTFAANMITIRTLVTLAATSYVVRSLVTLTTSDIVGSLVTLATSYVIRAFR